MKLGRAGEQSLYGQRASLNRDHFGIQAVLFEKAPVLPDPKGQQLGA
jgi:hypothetical protein